METYTEIQEVLTELGEVLTFTSFTLLGILEKQPTQVDMVSSFSHQEAYEITFILSTKDYITKGLAVNTVFTTSDTVLRYTYKIARPHTPTGDGWSKLPVLLTAMVVI